MDFKETLNLPDPNFGIPMKADLATREPGILASWDEQSIYLQHLQDRYDAPSFVLHDGPPYTNSPIHLGTAMNKVLKDFVVKSKAMQGFRAPYTPGYDNHGLPIEQAVMKEFNKQKITPTIGELRKACRAHAEKYIKLQTEQFKRLGILGLWELPYKTMEFKYEAEQVRVFKRLAQTGQLFRGLKPVLWSPTSRTALADTEIVYAEHTSKAIYVNFPLLEDHNGWAAGFDNVSTIIWTTTPWTIPANLAVAFHPYLEYAVVKTGANHFVVLKDLVERTMEAIGACDFEVVKVFLGTSFEHTKFKHPIYDRVSLGVLAEYVTTEDGTGVVHTAPGHGREDFLTGQKYGLDVLCPVDEKGVLTEEAGEFAGVSYKDCDVVVVDRLRELGHLLSVSDYIHQYPHAERDGKPVIFRATEQWFIGLEENDLRKRALEAIENVSWVPESGYARIKAMVSGRPDWCISRQRPWGVGIPVFYGKDSKVPVMDADVIELVAQLVEREGSDGWYAHAPHEILPEGYKHPITGETEFIMETDVFDVWFDSGSTSLAVLEGNVHGEWREEIPVDLYLEGSDQHRGWFNSSLLLSIATRGVAPYKQVLTHGFVNDVESGLKMSKRLGNAIDPVDICNTLGADVLRYWVASVDFVDDVPCGETILKACGEGYRKIRNTLRFLLSNLKGFDPGDAVENLNALDQWVVEQAELLAAEVVENYNAYQFRNVLTGLYNFCNDQLSAFYLDAIKDTMYCDLPEWESRRSAQTACWRVLRVLTRLMAPIMPYTAEEVYQVMPEFEKKASVHLDTFLVPSKERLAEIEGSPLQTRFANLLETRATVFALFDRWMKEVLPGLAEKGGLPQVNVRAHAETKQIQYSIDPQAVSITITESNGAMEHLKSFAPDELANLFKMSQVNLVSGEPSVSFESTSYSRCERSKLYRADVQEVNGHLLTARDRKAVGW